jgi:hypothetical protein
MSRNELHQLLDRLHEELQDPEAIDQAVIDDLQRLLTDIRHVLHRDEPAGYLAEEFDAAAARMEAHPLANLVNQVVDLLGKSGI